MQIAITIPDDDVDELDRLVPVEFASRSEVVRAAVSRYLAERRSRAIDAAYAAAYAEHPQAVDDIDTGRGGARAPHPWDDLEW